MQEVNYAVMAGCTAIELLPKLGLIANFIQKEKPDLKGLKRFFKQHDFFDKERFETLLRFLDIDFSNEKIIKNSEFMAELLKIIDPEDRKRHLFKHLTAKNEILMKYAMDALAERLHSTNEMYRYITSYVYPGRYLTFVDFKCWMLWLEASGHIKVVGIRWGLSELGKEAMDNDIKMIDVDDLLDEESADSDDDDDDDDDDDNDEISSRDDDDDDDDPAPAPKAAPAASHIAAAPIAAAVESTPISSTHVEVVVQPVVPKADETPLTLVKEAFAAADEEELEDEEGEPGSAPAVQIQMFRMDESLVEQNYRAVQVWWRNRPGGKLLTAADYGISKEDFDEDPVYALFRLSALALQLFRYAGHLNTSRGGQAYAMLNQMGFYSNLIRSTQSVDKILAGLFNGGLGQHADDFANLHYLLVIRRSLKQLGADGVKSLLQAESMSDVVSGLWQHIGLFQLTYEIIWMARELAAMGVVTCEDKNMIGVVPLPKVRETAFRLGFIETPYAADFAHLVSISRRLAKFFNADDAWEAPLVYFEPKRDLRYDSSEPAYFTRDQLGLD